MPIILPHTFHDGVEETASGQQVMDNFAKLVEVLEALENGALFAAGGHKLTLQRFVSGPVAGPAPAAFSYVETGIVYTNACVFALVAGFVTYNDAGHTSPVYYPMNITVAPSGKNVSVTFQQPTGGVNVYPLINLIALGY